MPAQPLRIALLGCGVVGTQVARLLRDQADDLAARVGAPLELVGIAVRDLSTTRDGVDPALLTTDARSLVERADIVVEVIGGLEPVRGLLLHAIESGASVVTANKALLAADGPTLYAAADAAGVDVYFEAAVAGAIPIIRPVRESLAGDRVRRIVGIVNGTTNYVLDRMATDHLGFGEAVAQAQQLGYAEADPTADVEGFDAAAKAAILASLAFHIRVPLEDVHREGITGVTAADVASAKAMGCVVKLLAIAERMKFVVPFTMPAIAVMCSEAIASRSVRMIGIPPQTAASKLAPVVSIRSRMKFVVPFTMPSTRRTESPASDSRTGRMIGIAPATAASK